MTITASKKQSAGSDQRYGWSALKILFKMSSVKKGALLGTFFFLCVASAAVLAVGMGVRQLIDQGLMHNDVRALNTALFMLGIAIFCMGIASYSRLYLVTWIGERFIQGIKSRIFQNILAAPISYAESTRTGELLARLNTDTAILQILLSTALPIMARNLLIMIGGIIMMLLTNCKLSLMVFLIVPCALIPIFMMGRRVKSSLKTAQMSIGDVGNIAEECIYAVKTVKSFCKEPWTLKMLDQSLDKAVEHTLFQIKRRGQLVFLVILIVFSGVGAVLWFGAQSVIAGGMTGGALSAFIFYAIIVAATINSLSESMGQIQRALGAAERLEHVLRLPGEQHSIAISKAMPLHPKIIFKNVSFSYPARKEVMILDEISFLIQPGERIAIVGNSGIGKTTIFQLLLGFYPISSGWILLDDIPINEILLTDLRQRIAFAPQDPVIFSGTIRDNILYGKPDATSADFKSAVDSAAVSKFVHDLSEGYDTIVGEKGMRLSGGQKQRISIARALLKSAPILLLDESTSSLDIENEIHVYKALRRRAVHQTIVVISHRLSTIQQMDRIILLDKGKIVASGTHNELLAHNMFYKNLSEL